MSDEISKAYADWPKAHKQLVDLQQELDDAPAGAARERESLLIRIKAAQERSERLLEAATSAMRAADAKAKRPPA